MERIANYFEEHAKKNPLFIPELNVSHWIITKIKATDRLLVSDIEDMITRINSIKKEDHFNGTGWVDFNLHFIALMKQNGCILTRNKSDQLEITSVVNFGQE